MESGNRYSFRNNNHPYNRDNLLRRLGGRTHPPITPSATVRNRLSRIISEVYDPEFVKKFANAMHNQADSNNISSHRIEKPSRRNPPRRVRNTRTVKIDTQKEASPASDASMEAQTGKKSSPEIVSTSITIKAPRSPKEFSDMQVEVGSPK